MQMEMVNRLTRMGAVIDEQPKTRRLKAQFFSGLYRPI
jgi:hypothetical protein